MALKEGFFNKEEDCLRLFFEDALLVSDFLQAFHLFVFANFGQLLKVLLEHLELLVSQFAEIPHLDERLGPISEDYAQF